MFDVGIDTDTFIFPFGKYKGEPYSKILRSDPFYIEWFVANIDWFELSDDDYDEVLERMDAMDDRDYDWSYPFESYYDYF